MIDSVTTYDATKEKGEEEQAAKIERYRTYKVTKSNEFIRNARSSLSVLQSKIITFIISQIEPKDRSFKTVDFSIMDFCAVCNIQPAGMYTYIKSALKALRDESNWIQRENEKGDLVEETFAWLEKVIITPKEGIVTVKLSEDLRPYLLELKNNFTSYQSNEVYDFETRCSVWFYDNIASYANVKSWTVSLDEIRKQTMKNYPAYKDLHRRVIAPAIKDINEHSSYNITYTTLKAGRKVDSLKFYIERKPLAERLALSEKKRLQYEQGRQVIRIGSEADAE